MPSAPRAIFVKRTSLSAEIKPLFIWLEISGKHSKDLVANVCFSFLPKIAFFSFSTDVETFVDKNTLGHLRGSQWSKQKNIDSSKNGLF